MNQSSSKHFELSARQRRTKLLHDYLHGLTTMQIVSTLCAVNVVLFSNGSTQIAFGFLTVLSFASIFLFKFGSRWLPVDHQPRSFLLVAIISVAMLVITIASPETLPYTILVPMTTLVKVMPLHDRVFFRKVGIATLITTAVLALVGVYTNVFGTHLDTPITKLSVVVTATTALFLTMRGLRLSQTYLEHELSESSEQSRVFESAINNAHEGVFITEGPIDALRIVYANQAFQRITGFDAAAVIGWSPMFLHGPKTDVAQVVGAYELARTNEYASVEAVCYRKDGRDFWAECTIAFVKSDVGDTVRNVTIFRDITQRKQNEEELEQRVSERTHALQAALEENNRLHEMELRATAIEERTRLARELHDSVSQALFGAVLAARTVQRIAAGQPELQKPVDFILDMSESALKEMRALIFELRPETLNREGLAQALVYQTEAMQARHLIKFNVNDCSEPDGDLVQKEAVYRIAVEALHNAGKHARATHVQLFLCESDDEIAMTVTDDGIGFDTCKDFQGHLGLKSMVERADMSGGHFEIRSEPDKGTCVNVRVPKCAPIPQMRAQLQMAEMQTP